MGLKSTVFVEKQLYDGQATHSSEHMVEMFQAAQLTHERYLNIDHFCTFFISSKLNFHRPLVCCILCYGRQWKFSLAGIKNIFCRSDLRSKLFHVLVVELETFSP